jgi:DNA-binding transcriptional ArsR family regulator
MSVDEPHFAELAAMDRLIHDPARLAIVSALLGWTEAEFQYLLGATGLTKGNLSSHLGKLEAGGLVEVLKGYKGKKPWTRAKLTRQGRARVEAYWAALERIRAATMSYK